MRLTSEELMPSIPIALARSSTRLVETPSSSAEQLSHVVGEAPVEGADTACSRPPATHRAKQLVALELVAADRHRHQGQQMVTAVSSTVPDLGLREGHGVDYRTSTIKWPPNLTVGGYPAIVERNRLFRSVHDGPPSPLCKGELQSSSRLFVGNLDRQVWRMSPKPNRVFIFATTI
jgi:hypothetical protein